MSEIKPIIVAKRDGSLEPFLPGKLKRVLSLAMKACRYDIKIAEPLVQAVEVHLQYWDEPRPPTTEYVFRCVRSILKQTGLPEAAEFLAEYRRWRRIKRRSIQVENTDEEKTTRPWRKTAIAKRMEKEFGVGRDAARIAAGELENRILNLGFSVISQALLDELVRNELSAWGLWGEEMPTLAPEQQPHQDKKT